VTINDFGNIGRSSFDGQSRLVETELRLTSSGQGDGTNIGASIEGVKTTASTVDAAQSGDGLVSVYYAYDDNSQVLAFRDDDGNVTGHIFDNQNRKLVERKGLGVTGTSFSISGGDSGSFNTSLRGGVTPVDSESAGTDITRSYDRDSNELTLTDEAGNAYSCSYDALNRRKSCAITLGTGFMGTTSQSWKYDGLSRMTESFDNNGSGSSDDVVCRFLYDSLSRQVEETQQIGGLSAKAVSCGFELDSSSGGPAVQHPSECIYPDGRKVVSIYDRLDRLVSRNDVVGTTQYSNIGTYEYIGSWRVAVLSYQNSIRLTHVGQVSGQNADTGFDGLRRTVNHRWESHTSGQALGNGTLVVGFEHRDGNSTPAPLYDRSNNKTIEYKSHDPSNSEQYKYDSAYRVASAGSGSQGQDARAFERGTFTSATRTSMAGGVGFFQDWDVEGVGNWTRQDDNGRVETRTHSDFNEIVDRVVSGNTSTLSYDKNGNATDTGYSSLGGQNFPGGGLRLEWDAFNRLSRVYRNNNTPGNTADDVLVAEYIHDSLNRRMRKVVTNSGALNGTTHFYYEGLRVVEERDGSDAVTNQYTYGNYLDEVWTLDDRRSSGTVASLNDNTGSQRHFYLSNTLYHVYGITTEGSSTTPGALKEAYEYDAFGGQTVITDGNDGDTIVNFSANDVRTVGGASTINGNPYMFTGQRFDAETGVMYFKNRYLLPGLGRFLNRNPWGYTHTLPNLYDYVSNRVTSWLEPWSTTAAAVGRALATGWSVAAAEPTPVGEIIMTGVTIVAAAYLLWDWLSEPPRRPPTPPRPIPIPIPTPIPIPVPTPRTDPIPPVVPPQVIPAPPPGPQLPPVITEDTRRLIEGILVVACAASVVTKACQCGPTVKGGQWIGQPDTSDPDYMAKGGFTKERCKYLCEKLGALWGTWGGKYY
jgi:RHS repeat-associated protein